MINVKIDGTKDPPDKYALKKFNCPACGIEHVYHCDSAKYCDNRQCGTLIPEINALLELKSARIAWHFGRFA